MNMFGTFYSNIILHRSKLQEKKALTSLGNKYVHIHSHIIYYMAPKHSSLKYTGSHLQRIRLLRALGYNELLFSQKSTFVIDINVKAVDCSEYLL